eukprot:9680138-Alexandrium_andersonii.AAC.1
MSPHPALAPSGNSALSRCATFDRRTPHRTVLSNSRYLGAYWYNECSTVSSAPPRDLMMAGSWTS